MIGETAERAQLREQVRRFTEREIVPELAEWERAGEIPRGVHQRVALAGLLAIGYPESVGGAGGGFLDSLTVQDEVIDAGGSSGVLAALFTHGIALPHLIATADPALIDRYVRPTLAGDLIAALAVTEPDAGSDVAALRTSARREGDEYVVNGSKTFITSGARADFVTTAVRTGPAGSGRDGISLLVIERGWPGFSVTRRLDKLGWHCSDTAELSFVEVRVPAANLVGVEGAGFGAIMRTFATERISLAVQACATAQRCLRLSVQHCRARQTFGAPLASRQVIRHRLAEMATTTALARSFVWQIAAELDRATAVPRARIAMAKNAAAAACAEVTNAAVQLHGGYGYMRESEVERHYRDGRIMSIGGGTTEIMNELIARELIDACPD